MQIKLVLTDIDGVWTDGGMYYDEKGNELKKFNTTDSAGVLFLHKLNIPVGIITGEDMLSVKHRAEKLKVDYVFCGIIDKLAKAKELCEKLNISLNEVAFIGDDLIDVPLLAACGFSAVPANAKDYVASYAKYKLNSRGGDGAFREFVELLLNKYNLFDIALKAVFKSIGY